MSWYYRIGITEKAASSAKQAFKNGKLSSDKRDEILKKAGYEIIQVDYGVNNLMKKYNDDFRANHSGTKTGKYLEIKGDIPLNYSSLLFHLNSYYMSYQMLLFAEIMFIEALAVTVTTPGTDFTFELDMGNLKKIIEDGDESISYKKKRSLRREILPLYEEFKRDMDNDDQGAVQTINIFNNQFLRKKFVNTIYEILDKYLNKYEAQFESGSEKKIPRKRLESQKWYCILKILRNAASHADGLEVKIAFPGFLLKAEVYYLQWETIEATHDMLQHTLRYNDAELKLLFFEMCEWIRTNVDAMTKDHEGAEFPNLI